MSSHLLSFRKRMLLLMLFSGIGNAVFAQSAGDTLHPSSSVPRDSTRIIHLIHADILLGVQPKGADSSQLQKLIGHVQLKQGNTLFTCDSALQNITSNTMDAYGDIRIDQGDSIRARSDFLHYDGNTKMASLKRHVSLTDGLMVLTTDTLDYDLSLHVGHYEKGGRLVNKTTVLTSLNGYYYADTKDVYFGQDVLLKDPDYTLKTDSLQYNTLTRIARFVSPTSIHTGKSVIVTSCGYYDTEHQYAHLCSRSSILDSAQTISADTLNFDKTSGIGIAVGNVVWTDTAQKISVLSNYAVSNQKNGSILATRKPLMILQRNSDTLYIAADTLFSGKLHAGGSGVAKADSIPHHSAASAGLKNSLASSRDSLRYLIAYHNVRIFSDSLQGVSDSLYYSDLDSAFHFYIHPVMWTGDNQLSADSIVLKTRNQQASQLILQQKALIVSKTGPDLFNQIQGRVITGKFARNQLDRMQVNGNAESMYYAKDDQQRFVGVNKTTSAAIRLRFVDGRLNQVVFLKDVSGSFIPPTRISSEDAHLSGFQWDLSRRPRSRYELME